MKKILWPNGNDLLFALNDRAMIRRKVTVLDKFVSAEEWFAKPLHERRVLMRGPHFAGRGGVWLDVQRAWAWFRSEPKTGALEVSFDKETWEPFPWPKKEIAP